MDFNTIDIEKNDSADLSSSTSSHKNFNNNQSLSKEEKKKYLELLCIRFDLKKKQHSFAFEYFTKLNYTITIPSILLGGGTSILSFINSNNYIDEAETNFINIGIGIVSTITTLLSTINSTLNFKTKASEHNNASKEYSRLLTEIQTELILLSDNQFIQYIETEELKIKTNLSSVLPTWIESKFT